MDEILHYSISDMAGKAFACSCGRTHSVDINRILIGKEAWVEAASMCESYRQGTLFLLSDQNTYEVMGSKLELLLQQNHFRYKSFCFTDKHTLIPDEQALGRILVEMGMDTTLLVAAGSGTLNDLARMISSRLGIPYVIVCTAPSMDGYASVVSPLIINGFKTTYDAVYPFGILADTDILREAPLKMIHAGFGDIIGKLTALADWKLSRQQNGEYYCETSVRLVEQALEKCIGNAASIRERDAETINSIMEALILSGVAMGLVGNSRPASGAEHHLAHYWEMDALSRGEEHALHGNMVGVGAVVAASIYQMLKEQFTFQFETPDAEVITRLLQTAGSCSSPAELGIRKELFRESLRKAMNIRPRYTVFHLIRELGLLEKYADILTERFYSGKGDTPF
jgi:glycerol-1-phosphate dehydrogenase [NAD(P)+]